MSDDKIFQKLEEHDQRFEDHDKRFDAVDKRLDDHDKRFDAIDKRFDAVDKRLDDHDKRFDAVDKQLHTIALKVVENSERLDQTATKAELEEFKDRQLTANDEIITILRRLDHERYATIEWLRRVETEVEGQKGQIEDHENQLQRIKKELKLAY